MEGWGKVAPNGKVCRKDGDGEGFGWQEEGSLIGIEEVDENGDEEEQNEEKKWRLCRIKKNMRVKKGEEVEIKRQWV